MQSDEDMITDMELPDIGSDLGAITIGDQVIVHLKHPLLLDGETPSHSIRGRIRLFSPSLYIETEDDRLLSIQRGDIVAFERPLGPRTEEEWDIVKKYLMGARETAKRLHALAVYVEGAMLRIMPAPDEDQEEGMYA
jgi:hypothetical protein